MTVKDEISSTKQYGRVIKKGLRTTQKVKEKLDPTQWNISHWNNNKNISNRKADNAEEDPYNNS